jgi:hypothetical protein
VTVLGSEICQPILINIIGGNKRHWEASFQTNPLKPLRIDLKVDDNILKLPRWHQVQNIIAAGLRQNQTGAVTGFQINYLSPGIGREPG